MVTSRPYLCQHLSFSTKACSTRSVLSQLSIWSKHSLELHVPISKSSSKICLWACVILSAFFSLFSSSPKDEHTRTLHLHTYAACSVTRRKKTQGEAAHLTGIQLSMSNGGHPEEEEGKADLLWWREAERVGDGLSPQPSSQY